MHRGTGVTRVAYSQLFSLLEAQVLRCSCLVGITGNEHLSKVNMWTRGQFWDRRERRLRTTLGVHAAIVGGDRHSAWPLVLYGHSTSAISLCGWL